MNKLFRNITIILLVTLSVISKAQTITKREVNGLHEIVGKQFRKIGSGHHPQINSQSFVLFLETDSLGKITNLHCLSDITNQDTSFRLFNSLTVKQFDAWTAVKCAKKIIALPIVVLGAYDDYENYVDKIFTDVLWKRQRTTTPKEDGRVILVETYIYFDKQPSPPYITGSVEIRQ